MFNKFSTSSPEARQLGTAPMEHCAGTVLLKLMFHMNRWNMVKGKPATLNKLMGISLWDFNHGVKALKKLDFVRKYTKWEYMVNPNLIFNGDEKQFYIVQHMWDTQTKSGLRNK